MNYEKIQFKTEGRVAYVTLHRPDVRNAFDTQMIQELRAAFDHVARDKKVSVLILRGEGKSFSSGADLSYMKAMAGFTFEENEKDARELDAMFWSLRECPVPVIAKVQGHVMGGALGLISLCDIVFAVEGTQFAFTEVRLGLAPAVISPYVLEKMAPSFARQYMLTGEVFGTTQAYESGLVQAVGNEIEGDDFLVTTTTAIVGNGPEAVRETKKLLRAMDSASHWTHKRDLTTKTIAERRVSAEGQEGLRGFLEKRTPKWKT